MHLIQFLTLHPLKGLLKGVNVNGLSHLPWGFGRIRLWGEFNLQKHHTTVHLKGHSIPFKTVLKIWPKAITLSCVGLLFPFLQPFMFVCSESKKMLPSQILIKRCLEKPFVLNKGSDNAFHFNGKSWVADTLGCTYPKRADHVSVCAISGYSHRIIPNPRRLVSLSIFV